MVSKVTSGVEVSVAVTYLAEKSRPEQYHFVFAYEIKLKNKNPFTVQLLRRKWIIRNGVGETEIVEGEGVVGRQPILYTGDEYEYTSGAVLETTFGFMQGTYYFENKSTREIFEVAIPKFKLESMELLN